MGVYLMSVTIMSLLLMLLFVSVEGAKWHNLNCEQGHKYFFSDDKLRWGLAIHGCERMGGWLLQIKSIDEQNCVVKYAQNHNKLNWWFHDGNDISHEGVFMHKTDNTDMEFVNWNWRNNDGIRAAPNGELWDVLLLGTQEDFRGGA